MNCCTLHVHCEHFVDVGTKLVVDCCQALEGEGEKKEAIKLLFSLNRTKKLIISTSTTAFLMGVQ